MIWNFVKKKTVSIYFVLILSSSNAPQCNNSTFHNISVQVEEKFYLHFISLFSFIDRIRYKYTYFPRWIKWSDLCWLLLFLGSSKGRNQASCWYNDNRKFLLWRAQQRKYLQRLGESVLHQQPSWYFQNDRIFWQQQRLQLLSQYNREHWEQRYQCGLPHWGNEQVSQWCRHDVDLTQYFSNTFASLSGTPLRDIGPEPVCMPEYGNTYYAGN